MYFDIDNHNVKYVVSSTKMKFAILRRWEPYIEVGDSISKKRNSFLLKVYKKSGNRMVFDYRDNYKVSK